MPFALPEWIHYVPLGHRIVLLLIINDEPIFVNTRFQPHIRLPRSSFIADEGRVLSLPLVEVACQKHCFCSGPKKQEFRPAQITADWGSVAEELGCLTRTIH